MGGYQEEMGKNRKSWILEQFANKRFANKRFANKRFANKRFANRGSLKFGLLAIINMICINIT